MKILTLHSDFIKFKALKKALKSLDLTKEPTEEQEVKDPLVVMTAVEKGDDKDVLKKLVKEIRDISKQVKAENIVLYPYAHLSSNLGNPKEAQEFLQEAEKMLKKVFKSVTRAPFGYYKEFEIKVKGHPLSELSREIKPEGEVKEEKYDEKQLLREISKSKLDTSKLKDNDHRILGQKLDLFSFNEVAPGMVFWHNNGLVIYNELINYWKEEHQKADYQEISTPQILDDKLWKISGHWEKYKENIFLTNYEKRGFAVKPMNCPGGMLIYKSKPKSYKELPLRVGELGVVHRQELSGTLGGLFRVVRFTQDDAHIYCTEKQVENEIVKIIEIIDSFYKKFNLKFDHIELSTRPEKRLGSKKLWDKAEKTLEKILKKKKMKYKINPGDGVFYGPKIDFHVKDSMGRTWQLSTVQLDFQMPERFDLTYKDKNDKLKRPIMLHRVIYGSLERFIGIILEHTNGALPTWLSPVQVRVINFTDRNVKACDNFVGEIKSKLPMIRVDTDYDSVPLGGKIRDAELMKIPYIIVLGDKEEKEGTVAVRKRGEKKITQNTIDKFIKDINKEIQERK
ncbi:threonine--tRNA ligase [Candidatus Pacearchaeota archaeon]|nr:threonine--tRNA ligase [Candidatus Pacearchaeota archaeon]|tara:strand:+ start:12415 stop:14112 length:1698 start_codon:yes stop_codon:yes gene_type:complete